ncbi:retrovirus-related Pol polyprotein from transposon TNT 1-94 [Pyrus ussuriensis x Pyrus communis]|uniref:Retrovirus-related Pol polyprotein from transposon TNT 1-94 n=1 Tax=Pyrus ussuriensis x Pyrus communis TaxID=2448454 RepID=A0A5N5GKW9_9ROSA|nr:retrovirus-related Pol polyprotein from transposon TNT 1-94 [Pyrus ussuriensis x Pyrus communis]
MNGSALKGSIEGDAWEWHKRLGHLNFNNLQLLSDKEMVLGLPKLNKSTGVCERCIAEKQHRDAFSNELTWRASKPLELVHSDVCGLMQVTTFGGNIYFLTFIGDATRITKLLEEFKFDIMNKYEITDLGPLYRFLGIAACIRQQAQRSLLLDIHRFYTSSSTSHLLPLHVITY